MKAIFKISIKNSITYPKHSQTQFFTGFEITKSCFDNIADQNWNPFLRVVAFDLGDPRGHGGQPQFLNYEVETLHVTSKPFEVAKCSRPFATFDWPRRPQRPWRPTSVVLILKLSILMTKLLRTIWGWIMFYTFCNFDWPRWPRRPRRPAWLFQLCAWTFTCNLMNVTLDNVVPVPVQ